MRAGAVRQMHLFEPPHPHNQGAGGVVHARDLHVRALTAVAEDDLVHGGDAGQVPQMGVAEIDLDRVGWP